MIKVRTDRPADLIKSRQEIDRMREPGSALAIIRRELADKVRPGVSTQDLEDVSREAIEAAGAKPAFLGYRGYPATICASVNEEVVHGIPSPKRILKDGDLISIDVGLISHGFYADTAITVPVGNVSEEVDNLIKVTQRALEVGVAAAVPGRSLGDLCHAIQESIESSDLSVVREYTGHGIGRQMHEDPRIPNFGTPGSGPRLREGMVLALEPMVNLGDWKTRVLDDGWTVVTADGKPSAHFEHTIALLDGGAEILTA